MCFGFWCFVDCVGVAGVWWVTLGTVFWWLLYADVAVVVMVFSSGFGCLAVVVLFVGLWLVVWVW